MSRQDLKLIRSKVLLFSFLAFLATSQVFAKVPKTLSAKEVADEAWADLQSAAWDTEYRSWSKNNPTAACTQFHGGDTTWSGTELLTWAYRCQRETATQHTQWSFYIFSVDQPLTCRLEHIHTTIANLDITLLREVYTNLLSRLQVRYGSGESPTGRIQEWGSGAWRESHRWQTKGIQIYLFFFSDSQPAPPSVGLFARHRHLLEAAAEEKQSHAPRDAWQLPSGETLDQKLVEELKTTFPNLPALLKKGSVSPRKPSKDEEELRTAILRMSPYVSAVPDNLRPVVLLAMDRLADRIYVAEPPIGGSGELRVPLRDFKLNYTYSELGALWVYGHDLLWQVWRDYESTNWGEIAFLILLRRGFDTSDRCAEGREMFRKVIDRGKEFLRKHANSPCRPEVVFHLARAYETWWSISQAGPQDDYVEAAKYKDGSERAREKAIEYYSAVLQATPDSLEAAYARRSLPALMLRLDPNRRAFYCIYD